MSDLHSHAQDAGTAVGRHTRPLTWSLGLNAAFFVVEVAGALWTGSLALLADAGHMLTDVGGLGLALFATWIAARPPTPEKTYGYYRVEVLAALVNALVLLGISAFILYEAYRRFLSPPAVLGGPMLAVAVAGLGVNLAAMWLLHAGAAENLNIKGAYLDALTDALGSLGVIAAALIVLTTGWRLADPIIGAAIGLFIVPRTWGLLRQAVNILLEGTPPHVNLAVVEAAMARVRGVRQVHDLHVWTLTSGKHAMSGHVVVNDLAMGNEILRALHELLHERFGIEHTTIQLESAPVVQIAGPAEEPPTTGRRGHGPS
jgi:cobalt-zinc-cadmium efflux system protein